MSKKPLKRQTERQPPKAVPKPRYLHIGALADASGRSVHTIRWYETQGLMPGVTRDAGGRRVYDPDHIGWLEFIEQLRQTGMSVAEMKDYAALVTRGRKSLPDRLTMLRAHRLRVKAELSKTRQALKLVESKIDYYDTWLETGERPPEIPRLGKKKF
ncbi:MerR family transcriptional regulator [Kordiimonas sp.]|uniref:MerR family transcriptional regulator n=1 Tax=Kordiimonas sp. TaxID=1970157 RepID=UPI003A946733